MDKLKPIELPENLSNEDLWMLITYLMDTKVNHWEDTVYDLIYKPMAFSDDTDKHQAFVDIVQSGEDSPYNLWRWNHLWRTHFQEQSSHYGDCVKFPTTCYVCVMQDHIKAVQDLIDKLKKATVEPNTKGE